MPDLSKNKSDTSSSISKPLGLVSLVCLVVASMIGSGVFTTSGFAIADLRDARLVMLAWVIGGLMAICGAIGYGAIAARLPGSGGEYLYLSRNIHPAIGFLAGWLSLIAGFTAPMALSAKTFAEYLGLPRETTAEQLAIVATAIILVAAMANSISRRTGAALQNLTVVVKIVLVLLFLIVAFRVSGDRWHANTIAPDKPFGSYLEVVLAVAGSLVWISLSYTGFNAAIYVAGETKDAQRLVPRAMLIATLGVTVLYLLLNYVFVYGAAADRIAGQADVAAIVAHDLSGPWLERLVRGLVCLANLTSVISLALAGPRVAAQMAEDGVMPPLLKLRGEAPRFAVWGQAILAIVVVWFSTLKWLLGFLGLTLSLCAALTVASLFFMRRAGAQANSGGIGRSDVASGDLQSLRWWESLSAVIYIVGTLALFALASWTRVYEFGATVGSVVIGLILLAVWDLLAGKQLAKDSQNNME